MIIGYIPLTNTVIEFLGGKNIFELLKYILIILQGVIIMVKLILLKNYNGYITFSGCDRCMNDEDRCPSGKMVERIG